MRFKISILPRPKHTDIVSGIGWMSPDEVYSCGDDFQLLQWNLLANETTKVAELNGIYPTELQWLPKSANQRAKTSSDTLLITTADGKFHILNRSGRIEKSVDAHRGAVLAGRWGHDGNALLTAGEDGQVKIWSRSGMLRSTLAQTAVPIYGAAWAPDSDSILYTSGTSLIIKPLAPNSKPTQWKAHDGIILKVAWNPNSGLILSGGEDTKYKVWDSYGRQLYSSGCHHHPITSLGWSPDGQLFAVGSFNTIRLCDKAGWCHSLEKPNTGSIFNLAWSSDGTQVAGACGNGQVLFAHIIERHLEWKNYEATVVNRTTITLRNVANEAREKLELRDRIIKVSLSYGHLVVVTSNQAYIYSTKNWNTPMIIDLKEGNVSLVLQAEKHFLLIDGSSILIYSYDGRHISSPRWHGMRTDVISQQTISLSNDTLAVRDKTDEKLVFLFDAMTGKALNDGKPWVHKMEIKIIALDQMGLANKRKLAVVDRNQDLFLVPIQRVGGMGREAKLGNMVHSLRWSDTSNQLAGLHDSTLAVWFYPAVAFVDRDLLQLTLWERDGSQRTSSISATSNSSSSEYGKNAEIDNFLDNQVTVRRADGSLVTTSISPYPGLLHNYVVANRWDDAVRLARFVKYGGLGVAVPYLNDKDDLLWACLAGFATSARELNTAEFAYAAINKTDKVRYIQYIKGIPIKEAQLAEMSLLGGHIGDAENIFLQSGQHFRAIMLNINTYQWERALQLALKYKTHIDTVLANKMRHLSRFGKKETSKLFLQYEKQIPVNWDKIQEKIEEEYQKEREKPREN